MEVVKTFFGPLECQPLFANQVKVPKISTGDDKEDSIKVDDNTITNDEKLETETKKEFKENFVVLKLEKPSPYRDCFEHENIPLEMSEEMFWKFVFSEEWSDFSTIRLCSGSVLKKLIFVLEDLIVEGCIESENIVHFDDSIPIMENSQGYASSTSHSARLQMVVYKWPKEELKMSIKARSPPSSLLESDSKTGEGRSHSLVNEQFPGKVGGAKEDPSPTYTTEFNELYFPKLFSNPTSRSKFECLNDYMRMKLSLKRSKHWEQLDRSEVYNIQHFLKSHERVNENVEPEKPDKLVIRKNLKSKTVDNKKMNKSPPIQDQPKDGAEVRNIREEIDKRLARKPLWMEFDDKMKQVFIEMDSDKSNEIDDSSEFDKNIKPKNKPKVKGDDEDVKADKEEARENKRVSFEPSVPSIVARISYSGERTALWMSREMGRCPDKIVLQATCRSNTLWSLPTPPREKCQELLLCSFPWRSVYCLECQRDIEELRGNLEDDLTQVFKMGRGETDSISSDEETFPVENKLDYDELYRQSCKHVRIKEDGNCLRSNVRNEVRKVEKYRKYKKPSQCFENEKMIKVIEDCKNSLEPSSYEFGGVGVAKEKPAEYLLAIMRKYQLRKELVSINAFNWSQSFTYLTINRPWTSNYAFC